MATAISAEMLENQHSTGSTQEAEVTESGRNLLTFRRKELPPSSGYKRATNSIDVVLYFAYSSSTFIT
jgi:hypothetical protein